MELDQAIKHALNGDALLFLGSGFSVGAKPKVGDNFLSGRQLARHLYKLAGDETDDDQLNYAADAYEAEHGPEALLQVIKGVCTASEVSELHKKIPNVPWKAIFTTNYDDILECAYQAHSKKLYPITPKFDTTDFTKLTPSCVHINGYAPNANVDDVGKDLKLTNASYLSEALQESNWGFLFRKALQNAKAVIFIGYSMYDIDIQRIVHQTSSNFDKTVFIERIGLSDRETSRSIQSKFGSILPIGLEGFVARVEDLQKTYVPIDRSHQFFYLQEIKYLNENVDIRDDDIFDLLFKGIVDRSKISICLGTENSTPYFLRRSAHDAVLRAAKQGERNFIVHSDMANGKSAFLNGVACEFANSGMRVFWLDRDGGDVQEDFENLLLIEEPVVVFFENILRVKDYVKLLTLKRKENLIIFGSIKSIYYENNSHELNTILNTDSHFEVDLDQLDQNENKQFCDLFSSHKFWGERDALPDFKKADFIKYECRSSLGSVLLEIIKSPEVQRRFSDLFEMLESDDASSEIITTASILTLINFDVSDYLILELTGNNYIYKSGFKSNDYVRELLDTKNGRILPKSSVLAKFALTNHADPKKLVDRIINITKRAHDRQGVAGTDVLFSDIYKELVNYSVLQSMLPEKGKRDALIRFYENTKNLDAAKNHPHFWLQYAIARLAYGEADDLVKAKMFLDAAYGHARNRGYKHFNHMDNVKARYLMKVAIQSQDREPIIENFRAAHTILLRQANNERNERPFRVARMYSQLFDRKGSALVENERQEIKESAAKLIDAASRTRTKGRANEEVMSAVRELQIIVDSV
jgi:SIR2-like domain